MARIIYHRAGRVSANRLGLYMGIPAESRIRSSSRPDYLIRYGSRRSVPKTPSERTINRRRMLNRYPDRLTQLRRMASAGVRVPATFEGGFPTGEPILGRDEGSDRQTTKGRGITYYPHPSSLSDPPDHDFFVRFIDKDRQFRVHVIGGETRTRELIPEDPSNREQPIWNYENGFTYRVPDDIPAQVVPIAVQAVKALWLDFGAVDVITHDRMAFVLEVNTAPGLADPTLEWYAEQLAGMTGITEMPGWEADGLEQEGSDA